MIDRGAQTKKKKCLILNGSAKLEVIDGKLNKFRKYFHLVEKHLLLSTSLVVFFFLHHISSVTNFVGIFFFVHVYRKNGINILLMMMRKKRAEN